MVGIDERKNLFCKSGMITIYTKNEEGCIDLITDDGFDISSVKMDKGDIKELIEILKEVIE